MTATLERPLEPPTIGSLFSGYGGLDRAVENFFGATTTWHCEFDAAPSKVLAAHWPDVPNLGDITKVKWTPDCTNCGHQMIVEWHDLFPLYRCGGCGVGFAVSMFADQGFPEPVRIATGGSPCQDLSGAGRRGGMTEGTRSNLWVQMRECIAAIRPAVVVWENVRGAYSACADSEADSVLGRCPRCMDRSSGADHAPNLRAILRVLGDLASLGFDAEVIGLRASDAGAPHARFRVFVVAYDTSQRHERFRGPRGRRSGLANDGRGVADLVSMFPTPAVADATGGHASRSGDRSDEPLLPGLVTLFPTPRATRGASNTETLYALGGVRDNDGDEQGNVTIDPAFPTTDVAEYTALWEALEDQSPFWVTDKGVDYWPAIERWSRVMGRKSPSPTIPDGKGGRHRLNPRFTEWLMGQPLGWITAPEIGLTRNEQLKACGNGVVTQQAEYALAIAWPRVMEFWELAA